MMNKMYERSLLVIQKRQLEQLNKSHVVVFGLGGVGGYVCEALARAGIGHLTLVDYDTVDETNLNRQIIALRSTIGQLKTELFESRIRDINPEIRVETIARRLEKDNVAEFLKDKSDYVVDAIDQVSAKLALIEYCKKSSIPIISSMGTGNKLDPKQVEVMGLYSTKVDPMARIMRKELKKRGIEDLKVVFSKETPIRCEEGYSQAEDLRKPGSLVFVPAAAGLILAHEVVSDILENHML